MVGSRDPTTARDRTASSDQLTREHALLAIEAAFATLERERKTDARLSDLADAIDAFTEGAWAVAVALAEASTSRRSGAVGAARPVEMARSWEELRQDFKAARSASACLIPIVGARLQIVGWTAAVPNIIGIELRHADAERLVGSRIVSRRVELVRRHDIVQAGGPKRWKAPWVCLALMSADAHAALSPLDVPRVRSAGVQQPLLIGRTRRWMRLWTSPLPSGSRRK
jgi:hypothetical protein